MRYLIIGNGVVGITAAQAIQRADAAAQIHIYGAEPYLYYSRPRLWQFIANQIEQKSLYFRSAEWYAKQGIHLHLGTRATALAPQSHELILADGSTVLYDRLLLAMGSRSFVPPIIGADKKGVFALRSLDDALAIKEQAQKAKSAVIIGGGLLGLETARAISALGLSVTVLEFFPYLLPRQLDAEGAAVLQSRLEAQGFCTVMTGAQTQAIVGDEYVTGVQLADGKTIPAELVVISTGIRSRIELAAQAGLNVKRGVLVDEQMSVGFPDVFAAGDVAEFEGRVYGIIPAAIEQANIAAANMVEPGSRIYRGTLPTTSLKITGIALTCLGEAMIAASDEVIVLRHSNPESGAYTRLAMQDGKIVGAILLGDKKNTMFFKRLMSAGRDVSAYREQLLSPNFDVKALATTQVK